MHREMNSSSSGQFNALPTAFCLFSLFSGIRCACFVLKFEWIQTRFCAQFSSWLIEWELQGNVLVFAIIHPADLHSYWVRFMSGAHLCITDAYLCSCMSSGFRFSEVNLPCSFSRLPQRRQVLRRSCPDAAGQFQVAELPLLAGDKWRGGDWRFVDCVVCRRQMYYREWLVTFVVLELWRFLHVFETKSDEIRGE